jgi:hypothetical protein
MSQSVHHALAASLRFWRPQGSAFEDILLGEFAGTALPPGLSESTRLLLPSVTVCLVDECGRKTLAPGGSIVVTSPMVSHGALSLDGAEWHAYVLFIGGAPFTCIRSPAAATRRTAAPRFPRVVIVDPQLRSDLTMLLDQMRAPEPAADCARRLSAALATLVGRHLPWPDHLNGVAGCCVAPRASGGQAYFERWAGRVPRVVDFVGRGASHMRTDNEPCQVPGCGVTSALRWGAGSR